MMYRGVFVLIVLVSAVGFAARLVPIDRTASAVQKRSPETDRADLIALENKWLQGQHDQALLNQILADDFLHPVPSGDLLTKEQHIQYAGRRIPAVDRQMRFGDLRIRLYGDVAVVNGVVIASDKQDQVVSRSIFTDVFAFRKGGWQAINAQENQVEAGTPAK